MWFPPFEHREGWGSQIGGDPREIPPSAGRTAAVGMTIREASHTRDWCLAHEFARHRAARPDPSRRKRGLLGMTMLSMLCKWGWPTFSLGQNPQPWLPDPFDFAQGRLFVVFEVWAWSLVTSRSAHPSITFVCASSFEAVVRNPSSYARPPRRGRLGLRGSGIGKRAIRAISASLMNSQGIARLAQIPRGAKEACSG